MKIETQKGVFELAADFSFENTLFSQILSDSGNQSAPITLPATEHNLRLVDFSHRVDSYYKPVKELFVVVSETVWVRQCKLVIHSVAINEGIECTIYFDRGSFYAISEGKTMQQLDLPLVKSPNFATQTEEQNALYLVEQLKLQYLSMLSSSHYCVAPLLTNEKIKEYKRVGTRIDYQDSDFILNGFHSESNATPEGSWNNLRVFEAEFKRDFEMNDVTIDAHKGFGMTPFLKLFYVLEKLFEKFEYTFDPSGFKEEVEFSGNIVILNNVADALYTGVLNYNQLLPDVSVKDFLKHLEILFAGKFVIDDVNRTASFVMYKNLFDSAKSDLTEYLVSDMKIIESDFQKMDVKDESNKKKTDLPGYEYISLPIQTEETKSITHGIFPAGGGTVESLEFNVRSVVIDKTVRKNSDIEVEGEIQQQEETSSKEPIRIARIRNSFTIEDVLKYPTPRNRSSIPYVHAKVSYRNITSCPYSGTFDSVGYARLLYEKYILFRAHSNMGVEVETNFPLHVLMNLDLNVPYYFSGQPYLIEKVTFALPFSENQTCMLRTLKKYEDRPGSGGFAPPIIKRAPLF